MHKTYMKTLLHEKLVKLIKVKQENKKESTSKTREPIAALNILHGLATLCKPLLKKLIKTALTLK